MHNWRPLLRAPFLGLGLGLVTGGFEAIKLAATLKLSLDFGQGLVLGLVTVLIGGLLGVLAAVPSGLTVALLGRRALRPTRHAAGMAITAALLACWYLWPIGRWKLGQGLPLPAAAFFAAPIGVIGVVWFNAHYWLRREDLGARTRLGWLSVSALFGLTLALLGGAWHAGKDYGSARALADDPSVLLISVDTLRQDHVSACVPEGVQPAVQTPALDALAAEGLLFTDAITPMPETAPAHAALMTGRHPVRNGVISNGHTLARGYQTLAEVLQGEGYATGAFVSSIAVARRVGLDQGFQVYDDDLIPWVRGSSEILAARVAVALVMRFADPTDFPFLLERPAPVTIDHALAFIDRDQERPWFTWVHLFEPHSPYEPHGLPGFEDNGTPDAPSVDHRAILEQEPGYVYDDATRHKLRRLYAEEVAYVDGQIGQLVARARELQGDRPLIIVVVADHGEMLGEHGIDFNHHGIWDPALRIPLIIDAPDLPRYKRVIDAQVRMMDVPSTILSLIELDPMEHSEGGDLLRLASGLTTQGFGSLLMGRRGASLTEGTLVGYRAPRADKPGDVKLIMEAGGDDVHMFALSDDPAEAHDIGPEQPQALEALRQRVAAEAGDLGSLSAGGQVDRGVAEGLKALGYFDE